MAQQQNPNVVQLCPGADKPAVYFKEIFVDDTFKIPEQKPDKEQIVNVDSFVTFEDVQTIQVVLPDETIGYKVFIAGNIYLDIQYTAAVESQEVHFVRFQLPFQAIIITDCGELIPEGDPILPDNYVAHVCLEKIQVEQIDERTIQAEVLLLAWLEQIIPTP